MSPVAHFFFSSNALIVSRSTYLRGATHTCVLVHGPFVSDCRVVGVSHYRRLGALNLCHIFITGQPESASQCQLHVSHPKLGCDGLCALFQHSLAWCLRGFCCIGSSCAPVAGHGTAMRQLTATWGMPLGSSPSAVRLELSLCHY